MKHFAEMEMQRRRTEKIKRSHSAREKMQAMDEHEQLKKEHVFEKNWTEEGRRDKRVGNWRDFQCNDSGQALKKSKTSSSFKTEKKHDNKHGQGIGEEWKKSWK